MHIVKLFRESEGRLPENLAEIFRNDLPTGRSGDGATDLYGTPLEFRPGKEGKGFSLTSLGKDGERGGKGMDADVTIRSE